MNIVLGEENIADIKDRMTVLELDSFRIQDQVVKSYCVLGEVNLQDLMQLESLTSLHANLIKNYRLKNWNYCRQAMEHLVGRWNGQIDSFYHDMTQRIQRFQQQSLPEDWDGTIER